MLEKRIWKRRNTHVLVVSFVCYNNILCFKKGPTLLLFLDLRGPDKMFLSSVVTIVPVQRTVHIRVSVSATADILVEVVPLGAWQPLVDL